MYLKLHPSQSFWFLPGGIFHLSFSDPGPKSLDYESLNMSEKLLIDAGISAGKLILTEDINDMIKIVERKKQISVLPEDQKLLKLAGEILSQSLPSIKHSIAENKYPIKLYKLLLEVEKGKAKPRGRVLDLLSNRLTSVQREVSEAISRASTLPAISTSVGRGLTPIDRQYSEVLEEKGESVTIELG